MTVIVLSASMLVLVLSSFWLWRRYVKATSAAVNHHADTCEYSLTDKFSKGSLSNAPHQSGVQWLSQVFSRSAEQYPDLTALQIPHTGESFTFAELDSRAECVAAAIFRFVNGPDQIVAVAMPQDNWHIIASHLGILKAGGALMFLDTSLPETQIAHMLRDAQPVVVLTCGSSQFRDLPTIDVEALPDTASPRAEPDWLDDPKQRLATVFYTSGTTGLPKGVECAHAGYVNLALTYADYFDLAPGLDACTLTSSLGYDGSISEMYSAWVSGCSVVLLTKEEVRSGPDLVPILREAEVTVLFCPPVLLTTLTSTPEIDLPYPICRYIVPAGEAFPPALVEPWTRGRRQIINTYGPTEASTDTSRQSLRPGEPITIGSPFPNVTYVILEVDGQQPLKHGREGELCIGGVHVALGYRNMHDLTTEKFVDHPQFGRLYRTGDRCRIDAETFRVEFLGRIDAQLKVRGHRVEIQGIEDILHNEFPEIEAAVIDYQNDQLIAFVAASKLSGQGAANVTPAPPEWANKVREHLAQRLPSPSVPSSFLVVKEFVLKPTSGKIDRGKLPNLADLVKSDDLSAPSDEHKLSRQTETMVVANADDQATSASADDLNAEVLSICRDVFEVHLQWDDVFANNGGHSIVIARLAQRLHAAGWSIPVRALLTDCDTPRKIAARPRQTESSDTQGSPPLREEVSERPHDHQSFPVYSVTRFTMLQFAFLLLLYLPALATVILGVAYSHFASFLVTSTLLDFVVAGFLMYLLALLVPFVNLIWAKIIAACLFGSRQKQPIVPGVYPKWSTAHLTTFCTWRLERSVLVPLNLVYRSPPLMKFALSQLGARVGRNLQCAQNVEISGPLTLLTVEDDVALQTGAYVQMSKWVGEELHIGPVTLGQGCKIAMRSAVSPGVEIGRFSWLAPFSCALNDVDPNSIMEGAPARVVGRSAQLSRTADFCRYRHPIWVLEVLNILMQCVLDFVLFVVPLAIVSWSMESLFISGVFGSYGAFVQTDTLSLAVLQLFAFAMATSWLTVVSVSVLVCLFLRITPMRPGLYPTRGLAAAFLLYRMQKMNQIQNWWTWTITGQYLRALAGVHFSKPGASECDIMFNMVPEATTVGTSTFWSNGSFTNQLDYGAEHIRLNRLEMGASFFSGNNCVIESGQFPNDFLLGVSTAASDIQYRRQMRS
ncbi:MAG: AMP-binding protein, partial [Rhizobiaceae bacterium]